MRHICQVFSILLLIASPLSAIEATQPDQDALCLVAMSRSALRLREREDVRSQHPEAAQRIDLTVSYFAGATTARYTDGQLTEVYRNAATQFEQNPNKAEVMTQCDARYSAGMSRVAQTWRNGHPR